jgi:hypothetical protein
VYLGRSAGAGDIHIGVRCIIGLSPSLWIHPLEAGDDFFSIRSKAFLSLCGEVCGRGVALHSDISQPGR